MDDRSPLNVLRKKSGSFSNLSFISSTPSVSVGGLFFFWLKEDDFGCYVEACDLKKKKVFLNEGLYNEPKRSALKIYNRLNRETNWQVDWGRGSQHLYLKEHPQLVEKLLECDNLVSSNGESIQRGSSGDLILVSKEYENKLQWNVFFQSQRGESYKNYRYLSPSLVLASNLLFTTNPVNSLSEIDIFNCFIDKKETAHLLSLFLSNFPDAKVKHSDYKIVEAGQIPLETALVLEKVDSSSALYLNVASYSENVDLDFLNNYDLSRLVSVDEEHRLLNLFKLNKADDFSAANKIDKILKKNQNKEEEYQSYSRMDNLFILESNLALNFIQRELHRLLSDFILVGAEQLKKYKIRPVAPKIKFNAGSGIDFLEGKPEIIIDDEPFGLTEFLQFYDKNRYVLLNDGTKAIVENSFLKRLQRLFKGSKEGQYRLSFFDLPLIAEFIDDKTTNQEFLESRRILEGFNTIPTAPLPRIDAKLRDYQVKGYNWLSYLQENGLGGCLADDMGLGKTIQSITLLAALYERDDLPSSLIVMPRSLLYNWQNEVARFAPQLSTAIYHGTGRDLESCCSSNLILTTYAVVRNDIEVLREIEFTSIVLDESQNIKNTTSQISRAVMLLQGRWRLALSGTPVENNLGELYALFRFLNPGMFGGIKDFQRDYFRPIVKDGDQQTFKDLKTKIYPFLLRRMKTEVLKDLPEKTEQVLYVEMSPEQEELYETRRQYYKEIIDLKVKTEGMPKAIFALLQALNELRQIAGIPESRSGGSICSPKKELLSEYLVEVVRNGHKALVYANYLEALNLMEEELSGNNIPFLKMTGKTRNRQAIVDMFQNDEEYKVLLMTLKTGGVGLNLTAADYVFIFDPWWNASAESQAVDRVHRIGQKNSVFSYKLITRNTIEEKILQLQNNKKELVNALIESDGKGLKSLSEEDIDFIFSGNKS